MRALIQASRPKTLSASVVPVIVGTALVAAEGRAPIWWVSWLAVLGAIFIQIATNLINDSIDFSKGADTSARIGETRITASGLMSPKKVMGLGFLFLLFAIICGVPLVMQGGWPIVAIGLVSVFLAYAYTGGPFPLAYKGLGDLFVILFFGLIAVSGVYYLHTGIWSQRAIVAGLQVGLLATVLIAINNIRDREQDEKVNKRTLAVLLGPEKSKWEIAVLFALAFTLNTYWANKGWWAAALLPLVCVPLAWHIFTQIIKTKPSQAYNRFLALSSLVHLSFGIFLSLGFVLR